MTPQMMTHTPEVPTGPALRAARKAVGCSIEQLAVYAGIGSATVERIELEKVTPRRATLLALSVALDRLTPTSSAPADDRGAAKAEAGGRRGGS